MATEATETTEAVPVLDLMYGSTEPAEAPAGSTEAEAVASTADEEESTETLEDAGKQTESETTDEQESEELPEYDVTLDGESRKVTRSELIKGYQLESVATKRTMEAAEVRKTAEAKIAQADEALTVLTDIQGEISSLLLGDVKNIDWDALRESDVSEYLRLKDVAAQKEKVVGDLIAKRNQLMKQKTDQEADALHKVLGWSDTAKKQGDIALITGFLTDNGISQQITDHKLMAAILKEAGDAAKYRKLQEDKAVVLKEVRKAPNTTKPTKIPKPEAPKTYADLMYKS